MLIDVSLKMRFQEAMPLFVIVDNSLIHSSAKTGTYMVQTDRVMDSERICGQGIWRADRIYTDKVLARALSKWWVKRIQELEGIVKVDTRRIS